MRRGVGSSVGVGGSTGVGGSIGGSVGTALASLLRCLATLLVLQMLRRAGATGRYSQHRRRRRRHAGGTQARVWWHARVFEGAAAPERLPPPSG